jgi:hypothetical protein
MANQIHRLLSNTALRDALKLEGVKQTARFSWFEAARLMWNNLQPFYRRDGGNQPVDR